MTKIDDDCTNDSKIMAETFNKLHPAFMTSLRSLEFLHFLPQPGVHAASSQRHNTARTIPASATYYGLLCYVLILILEVLNGN